MTNKEWERQMMRNSNLLQASAARLYYLDWLRILAFLLLIFYHTGMYYVTWDWHVKSPQANSMLEPVMVLSSPWRLSLLFFISGAALYFYQNKAPGRASIWRRCGRLFLPLVFGMFVIVPVQAYYEVLEKYNYNASYLEFMGLYLQAYSGFCQAEKCLSLPTWNHLWFVAYLLVYSLLVFLMPRRLQQFFSSRHFAGIARPFSVAWLVLLSVLIALRLVLYPHSPSTHNLTWDWYNHVIYFGGFFLAYCLAKEDKFWLNMALHRRKNLCLSLSCGLFLFGYFTYFSDSTEPPYAWLILQRVIWATYSWSVIATLIGYARTYLNFDHNLRGIANQAIFCCYILHQSLIILFTQFLKPWHLSGYLEAGLIIVATLVSSAATFQLCRYVPGLNVCLGIAPKSTKEAHVRTLLRA